MDKVVEKLKIYKGNKEIKYIKIYKKTLKEEI